MPTLTPSRRAAAVRTSAVLLGVLLTTGGPWLDGRHGSWGAAPAAAQTPAVDQGTGQIDPQVARIDPQLVQVDAAARTLTFPATLQIRSFVESTPPDDHYHALVHDEGGAAGKALLVTPVSDRAIADLLREMGARDSGGIPMSAWNLRWVPLIPQPDHHAAGSRVQVFVRWEGASRAYTLQELLQDPGGRGVKMRFEGNEDHDHVWPSGCILCLFSCPGGVMSNAAYSIRDHEREETRFDPGDELPPDGAPVTVSLALAPG